MNTNSKKIGQISRKQPSRSCSTVGFQLPLVWLTSPTLPALVGKKIPSVALRRQFGFTLIELMVTLVIAAILVSIAVPNMRTFIQNGRLSTQVNDFISDITLARSEAIKRGTNVALCASTSGTACPALASSTWGIGHMIFVDLDNSSTWSANDLPLRFREALGGVNTQNSYSYLLPPAVFTGLLVFNPQGNLTSNSGSTITFNLCDERGTTRGRSITLNRTGQVRVQPSPASCP